MGKNQRGARPDTRLDLVAIQIAVRLVRHHHGHDVGPRRRLPGRPHREPVGLGLRPCARGGFQPDDDIGDARIAQVQRMRPALAAIADDGDALAANDRQIAVSVVEYGQRSR